MRGNPEFIRNLWLEFTLHRVIVMPAVVGILFLLMYLVNGQELDGATAVAAAFLFCAIIFIWGTRVAAESVIQEINARTWDTQRMSAMGPWGMAWGKLFGSTIFVWYGGLICMGLYWMSYIDILPEDRLAKLILVYLLSGVIAHATGLLVSMQAVQKRRDFGRVQVVFYLLFGFAAAIPGLYIGLSGWADDGIYRVMLFYDQVFPLIDCVLIALLVYSLWALIGIWRMMRAELQMVNGPWVWLAFVAFTVAVAAGIRLLPPEVGKAMPDISSKAYHGYAMLLFLTYVIALAEPKGPVLFRRFAPVCAAVRLGQPGQRHTADGADDHSGAAGLDRPAAPVRSAVHGARTTGEFSSGDDCHIPVCAARCRFYISAQHRALFAA